MSLRLLLLGAPGSGKGTVTSRLLRQLPSIHALSTGDLLRREIQNGSALGIQAKSTIAKGALLPDSLMTSLVKQELKNTGWINESFLLDGFPRTLGQAKLLDTTLGESGHNINLVVELNVPIDVIVDRVCNRWIHPSSGRVYNLKYNPPKVTGKDDITGEDLVQRQDDTEETVRIRLNKYLEEVDALREYYKERGVWTSVSGETSDIVFPKLLKVVQDTL
ncbi:adenylate kinase [Martiniozyma asiatica (nom. inval.)]|nr:adenylate kinase [Martiniozyma asiatica]